MQRTSAITTAVCTTASGAVKRAAPAGKLTPSKGLRSSGEIGVDFNGAQDEALIGREGRLPTRDAHAA